MEHERDVSWHVPATPEVPHWPPVVGLLLPPLPGSTGSGLLAAAPVVGPKGVDDETTVAVTPYRSDQPHDVVPKRC